MTTATTPMSRRAAALLLAALPFPGTLHAAPTLPQRDLIVELRAVGTSGAGSTGWDLSSNEIARDRVAAQRVRVSNGLSASLSLAVARPVQTWQVLPGVWRGVVAPTTTWIGARQSITVQPRWPGGAKPVAVTLRAVASQFDPSVAPGSAEPPQRREAEIESTVELALGAWTVIATSGEVDGASGNVVGTRSTTSQSLQMRVSLAP